MRLYYSSYCGDTEIEITFCVVLLESCLKSIELPGAKDVDSETEKFPLCMATSIEAVPSLQIFVTKLLPNPLSQYLRFTAPIDCCPISKVLIDLVPKFFT